MGRKKQHDRGRRQALKGDAATAALSRASAGKRAPLAPIRFVGEWRVRRKIVDHLATTTATFAGQATITPTRFEECGTLTLGSNVLNAARTYRLRFTRRSISVAFPDGAEFIVMRARPSQTVQHRCGADFYTGRFFFIDEHTWAEAWQVVGPRKRYASLTRYTRTGSEAGHDSHV